MSPLRITEIYPSIQGEAAFSGYPCVFIRLTGCPLRCRWCDTVYGFDGGSDMEIPAIVEQVRSYGLHHVELTGGEPLAQEGSIELLTALVDAGFRVMIETSGSESIAAVPRDVHIIMDIKCPGSGMMAKNRWSNLDALKLTDEIKFVVADRADFDWALMTVEKYELSKRCQLLFSCAFGLVKPSDLSQWMVDERAPGRMQLQMHKYIWHPRAKGV